jgi:rSAM/selenodomain-associated transferase 1
VNKAIAIFARAPVPGQVKTRLAHHIGGTGAARLYAAMLRDTIAVAQSAAGVAGSCQVVLAYTPEMAFERGEFSLGPFWRGARQLQCNGDLGLRMLDCIARLQEQGKEHVVLIGSDTPHLPLCAITHCFELLTDREMHLCRTADGGFNLIGAGAPLPEELFHGVEWSTERVFDQVARNAKLLRLKWSHSFDGHDDVDTYDDLQNLVSLLRDGQAVAPQTARCLRLEGLL